MLNESVIKLSKNAMQALAICADREPNVVPVAFNMAIHINEVRI